ncbi:hypothetical protein Pcinc_009367 [Petrolisthes cinctipes]|uniref:Uncharacterized protein n=1 Tax=Petrolisthes cinctipes TaxID=88211 RepID=A0AAE1G5E3_PETCI|nr:hypothetical protein Pcinc_009367 [Petrolisthes cinctipes]
MYPHGASGRAGARQGWGLGWTGRGQRRLSKDMERRVAEQEVVQERRVVVKWGKKREQVYGVEEEMEEKRWKVITIFHFVSRGSVYRVEEEDEMGGRGRCRGWMGK